MYEFDSYLALFYSIETVIVGHLPLFFSRTASVPSEYIKKEASSEIGDGTKPCCGCLGRDTIANAAARVGPAVVNLSVPQGMLCYYTNLQFVVFFLEIDSEMYLYL